jgi:hypothetical protein
LDALRLLTIAQGGVEQGEGFAGHGHGKIPAQEFRNFPRGKLVGIRANSGGSGSRCGAVI